MKVKKYDGGDLRRVLIGMVTDQTVCSRVASQWPDEGLFDADYANLVGGWCVNHLQKYGSPPNDRITGLFETWATKTTAGEKTVGAVEKFLHVLSDESSNGEPSQSSDYLLDVAGRYFNMVRMKRAMEAAGDDLARGRVDQAYGRLTELTQVEMGAGALVKPAEDYDVWQQAFDTKQGEPLAVYPGYMNRWIGRDMVRDSLIAFMGPDKSGKSMMLLDLAFRVVRARHRVAYFEAGDMGRDAVMRRLGTRATRRPMRPETCKIPISIDGDGNVEHREVVFDRGLSSGEGYKAFRKTVRGKDLFRLSCHPNSSVNVAGITSVLRDWEREGWVADVVAIDYADILAPPAGVRDTLDQIDTTWRHLRRLSQELHCLVVTATQSSSLAYNDKGGVLGRKHFSGRKTKLAHVNGMIGINQTTGDKENGVVRLNWVVKRDGYYVERRWEAAAGCPAIANPVIRSRTK